jgi:hypothetical protein
VAEDEDEDEGDSEFDVPPPTPTGRPGAAIVPERPAPERRAAIESPVVLQPPPGGASQLNESDVRRWLEGYARAWALKDITTLRRMGQVRSPAEADQLERYFRSVSDLRVDVRVRAVRIDGDRAAVELERTDIVTDASGRRQELRLPTIHKEVQRTADGFRFAGGED